MHDSIERYKLVLQVWAVPGITLGFNVCSFLAVIAAEIIYFLFAMEFGVDPHIYRSYTGTMISYYVMVNW